MNYKRCLLLIVSLFAIAFAIPTRADEQPQSWNGANHCIVSPERTPQSDEALSGLVACQIGDDVHPITPDSEPGSGGDNRATWTPVVFSTGTTTLNSLLTLSTLASFNLLPHP
jgi:hypothetical protein